MNKIYLLLLGIWVCTFIACDKVDPDPDPIIEDDSIVEYVESFEDFANPERGFYRYSQTNTSGYSPLSESKLINERGLTKSSGAKYSSYNTLVYRYFVFDNFKSGPIDAGILDQISEDFNIARRAGVKLIPRFCYTVSSNAGDCPEDFICPPYGDAPKDVVLEHITQLAPILNEHEDVILAVQMGFIGTWGENYYTDYFGDASLNGGILKLLDENWQDRIDVLQAMLDNISQNLMIQVRYTQMKQRAIYGIDSKTNVDPTSAADAYSGSDMSRIGFHNDCLFASVDDFGTYEDYGNDNSPRKTDLPNLKSFFREDSKYVIIGGETCYDGYSPKNDCEPAGIAMSDLRSLHYTYLNADYNNQVNNDWVDGGCMDSIKMHLGYRYVMTKGEYELKDDRKFEYKLGMKNVGYASVYKDKLVQLVLRNRTDGKEFLFDVEADMKRWYETAEIKGSIDLPSEMGDGNYSAFLVIKDGSPSLQDRKEYNIRLANVDCWEETTGYNDLGYILKL